MEKVKKERFKLLKKIREYWKIPRYRSLMTLGLYLLFFAVILLYIHFMSFFDNPIEEKQEVNAVLTLATMDNYEYYYEIDSVGLLGTSSYTISGIRYEDQDNFKIGNDSFYVQDNIIYSVDENKQITDIVQIDLLLLRPNQIYEFLRNSTSANRIEYQNGEAKVTYSIPVTMFNIAFLQGIDETNTDVVEITTYEKSNQIYQIDLNIYNLMKLVDSNFESYMVKITYANIDNIKKVEELK